ncbi:hypothetical protein Tdes44962_MAKER05283 [Teratosphaeria destructans]|uniref:Uncharacterized protein n=1 Tax=Teratosphaeria destructans TaxID=418781 RepID=A0A9W7VZA4_9PEZI|nr:hypothetical protein Tdes44962_MAKER05283 [Teratosphaeria destructans]
MASTQPETSLTSKMIHHQRALNRKPMERVDIYICDQDGENAVFVRTVPLWLIVRFSKAAMRAFPKSKDHAEAKDNTHPASGQSQDHKDGGISTDESDLANVGCRGSSADDGEASWAVVKDKHTVRQREPASNIEQSWTWNSAQTVKNKEQLFLKLDGAYEPVHHSAISTCLDWMYLNSDIHNYAPLRAFHISGRVSLHALVNAYAAVLTLDMRPFPREVRHNLLTFLTEEPPDASDLNYLFYRLPDTDVALTRAITSIVEAQEKGTYEDNAGLQQLLSQEAWLRYRFKKLRGHRNKSRKEHNARSSMDEQWQVLEEAVAKEDKEQQEVTAPKHRRPRRNQQGNDVRPAVGTARSAAQAKPETKAEPMNVAKEVEGGEKGPKVNSGSVATTKKARSSKEGNGRGKGGRHVPGAEYPEPRGE